MSTFVSKQPVAHRIDPRNLEALDLPDGQTLEFLVAPEETGDVFCMMRGTVHPGGYVPLHSHADAETFFPISGELEGLTQTADGFAWVHLGPTDMFHVPGGAKHAWRNASQEPGVVMIVTTGKMGRFFREIGRPITARGQRPAAPPSAEAIRQFLETARRYGYWMATPEENAAVGLAVPRMP